MNQEILEKVLGIIGKLTKKTVYHAQMVVLDKKISIFAVFYFTSLYLNKVVALFV